MVSPHAPSNGDAESGSAVLKHAPRTDSPALGVGTILSKRYRLTGTLEVGHAATEYRAERIADGQSVAVKVFHEVGRGDSRRIERLRRPVARGAGPLDLPDVFTAVFECALTDDGRLFLATELVDDPSAAELLKQASLGLLRGLELAMHVGEALEVALNRGFVDLRVAPCELVVVKDENRIRLRRSDVPILMRLGLADQLAEAEAPGRDPRYTPPEEIPGLPATEAGVVYQFGLLLHELLCGRTPFDEAAHADSRDRKRRPPEVQIRKRHRTLPPSVDRLVSRMLNPDPDMRPQSLTLVLNELWAAVGHVQAKVTHGAEPLPAPRVWRPRWALAGLAALVLGGAAVTWLHVEGRPGMPVRSRLEMVKPTVPRVPASPPVTPSYPRDTAGEDGQTSHQGARPTPSDPSTPGATLRPSTSTPPTGGTSEAPRSKKVFALPGTAKPHGVATEATPRPPTALPRTVDPSRTPVAGNEPASRPGTESGATSTAADPPPRSAPEASVSRPPARPPQPVPDNPRAGDPGAIIDWLVRESPRVTE